MSQTQLLFNEAIPASASNRASHVRLPAPIVIERLCPLPPSEERENVKSPGSSISFTALSEERLYAAVQLARRDLRRRRLKLLTKSPERAPQEVSALKASDEDVADEELATSPSKTKLRTSRPKNKTSQPGAKLSVVTSRKNPISLKPQNGQSPPTNDPGPWQLREEKSSLSREIIKLQNELEVYVQKVEDLANRAEEENKEQLDPDEELKLELRREKQAARSSRTIYVLQQQVKKIQEDIEMFRHQKTWNTKKSIAINRLAAAHRGTLRALQVVIHQLSDISGGKVPPCYKELGQLIRQLSLCSAKVEEENGSAVPDTVLNILQKLETLDSTLIKQVLEKKMQARARSLHQKSSHPSLSPTRAPEGHSMSSVQRPRKPAQSKRAVRAEKRKIIRKPRVGVQRFAQQRELQRRPQTNTAHRKGGAPHSEENKADILMKHNQNQDAGFQQPTVSSQLRVNQVPLKEHCVPWMPTSPHSSPRQRLAQRSRAEPRCLFSPVKPSTSPPKQKAAVDSAGEWQALSSEMKKQAHNEALRKAWLDKMTTMRLKELNRLSQEEGERIQTLRSQVISPTQWAERAERQARERIQPLLDEAQLISESQNRVRSSIRNRLSEQPAERAAESAEQLSEALLENLLEDAAMTAQVPDADMLLGGKADHRLQTLTLESMLRHMEEIQRDQEEVRKRNASICYSDLLYWDRAGAAGPWGRAAGSGPASPPQPIRLTRPTLKQTSAADIVLEKPVETGMISDNSLTEEVSQDAQQLRPRPAFPGPAEPSRGTVISVPSSMLGNIRRYREARDAYLRDVAHEAVGSFNPWAVADSLADELLSDAVAEVAAEFQDVVEEYAEAVFTSEFLQPIQSPPAFAAAAVSQ